MWQLFDMMKYSHPLQRCIIELSVCSVVRFLFWWHALLLLRVQFAFFSYFPYKIAFMHWCGWIHSYVRVTIKKSEMRLINNIFPDFASWRASNSPWCMSLKTEGISFICADGHHAFHLVSLQQPCLTCPISPHFPSLGLLSAWVKKRIVDTFETKSESSSLNIKKKY